MKKLIIILALLGLLVLGIGYIYYRPSCSRTLISEEPLAYTPDVERKFLLARNAADAFKETGFAPKIA